MLAMPGQCPDSVAHTAGDGPSMHLCWHMATAAVLLLGAHIPARGDVVSSTKVIYFDVVGSTPAEIYRNILDRGPRIGGSTSMSALRWSSLATSEMSRKKPPAGPARRDCREAYAGVSAAALFTSPRSQEGSRSAVATS